MSSYLYSHAFFCAICNLDPIFGLIYQSFQLSQSCLISTLCHEVFCAHSSVLTVKSALVKYSILLPPTFLYEFFACVLFAWSWCVWTLPTVCNGTSCQNVCQTLHTGSTWWIISGCGSQEWSNRRLLVEQVYSRKSVIQIFIEKLGAVITMSSITWYCMQYYSDRICIIHGLNLQMTTHSSPSQVSYGVSIARNLEKIVALCVLYMGCQCWHQ